MKNSRFVVIDTKKKEYAAFDGRNHIMTVISDYPLYPEEVEAFRVNAHNDFDGEDPDGDLVA